MILAAGGKEPVRTENSAANKTSNFSTTKFLIVLAIYFGLHVATRSFVSNNLQLDEAEQLVMAQQWRLGYGSQPPLYNWLQNSLFSVIGVNVFALSLLKNTSLFAAYAFAYFAAREILLKPSLAALAAASMLFIPQLAWESQRDQSHLVLATTCAAATLFTFVRLLKTNSLKWYALFGLAMAAGLLSKYNYLLLPASLICACLITPGFRRAILTWKIFIALGVCIAVSSPHLIWALQNKAAVASQSNKFLITGALAPSSAFAGILQVLKACSGMLIAPLLIYSPLLLKRSKTNDPFLSLLTKTFLAGFALLLAVVIISNVTYLRDRWVQPLLFALPILLVGLVREQLTPKSGKILFALSGIVALTVLTAINMTVVCANLLNRSHNLNIPYPALSAELRAAGFQNGTIVANGFLLGGNLKNQFRQSRVIVPELDEPDRASRPTLIIWSARLENARDEFLDYAARIAGVDATNAHAQYLDIPCQNGPRNSEKFGYILVR
ncbi:MAG TPA: glycosyltransferase family 39 protein [Verrucomicrobiae bacterium]|nr:glycosyltransferase family 39 protein [Verrucomicrobiae bacterium]